MPRRPLSFGLLVAALALLTAGPALVGAQAAAKGTFVAFNPATFTVKDLEPAKVKIKLLENPGAVTATVFLEADGVLFDKCRLDFTGANYGTEQEVTVYPKAAFTEGESVHIFGARLAWVDNPSKSHNQVQSITFKRDVKKGRLCQSNGDPHYVTFDNRGFDYYLGCAGKYYYLMKSDTLTVMSHHGKWIGNQNNAVNVALAVAYGKTVYIIDGMKTGAARITKISGDDKGVQVIQKDATFNDFQLMMSDGAQVKVTVQGNGALGNYLDVSVIVPACYFGRTKGLCGTYDNNAANDLVKPDGTQTGDAKAFGDSWEVPAADNIFLKQMNAGVLASLKAQPVTVSCSFPADFTTAGLTPIPEGYNDNAVVQGGYEETEIKVAEQKVDPSRGDAPFKAFVTALCTEIIDIPSLKKVPQLPTNLVATNIVSCVEDCQLMGGVDPVEGFRAATMQAVHSVASNSLAKFKICEATKKPRPRTAIEVEAFAREIGFDSFKCATAAVIGADNQYDTTLAGSCTGHGTCMTFGCKCAVGWSGKDCNIDMAARRAKIPPKAAGDPGYTA